MLGIVLIAAGTMKLIDVYTEPDPAKFASSTGGRLLLGAEIAFGAWLVVGLFPQWSRLAAIAVHLGLMNVALTAALEGRVTCGCFGRAPIGPWVAFGFDLSAVVALLATQPAPGSGGLSGWRRIAGGIWAVVVAALLIVLAGRDPTPWVAKGLDSPVPRADKDLLTQVIDGIEANSATYRSLSLSVDEVTRNLTVAGEERNVQKLPGGSVGMTVIRPLTTRRARVIISPDGLLKNLYENDNLINTEAITPDRYYEYTSKVKRAWVRDPEVIPRLSSLKANQTTWGLGGLPLARPRDWFAAVHILDVSERVTDAGPVVEARAEYRPPLIKRVDTLVVRFAAAFNYLPIEAEQRMSNGRLTLTTDVTYQRLPGRLGWIPATILIRHWGSDAATEKDPSSLRWTIEIKVHPPTEIDLEVPPEMFSPGVSAGTTLSDSRPGDRETRTLKVASASPEEAVARFRPPEPTPDEYRAQAWRRLPVWPFVVANGLAFAVCFGLRKRLGF
jgi:hypothetical protein